MLEDYCIMANTTTIRRTLVDQANIFDTPNHYGRETPEQCLVTGMIDAVWSAIETRYERGGYECSTSVVCMQNWYRNRTALLLLALVMVLWWLYYRDDNHNNNDDKITGNKGALQAFPLPWERGLYNIKRVVVLEHCTASPSLSRWNDDKDGDDGIIWY